MKIQPEPYEVVAEDAVELIGRSFNFTHQKGLVEWIKNSWDAYQRNPERLTASGIVVILQFLARGKAFHELRVIDFCGMTGDDIDRAFKRWFDMKAATKGLPRAGLRILGGHGNGGKFYMRQMFGESRIYTWIDGKANGFGFNAKKEYGFVSGQRDAELSFAEAAAATDLPLHLLPDDLLRALQAGATGFTIVRGWKPRGGGSQTQWGHVLQSIREQPQMALLLEHMNLSVWVNVERYVLRLTPERPEPHADLVEVRAVLPQRLPADGEEVTLRMHDTETEVLIVRTSGRPLTGRFKTFNRLDVLGEVGVIASYPISELPMAQLDGSEYLHAVLQAPSLETGPDSLVENARDRLIPSPKTTALLHWMGGHLDLAAKRVAALNAKERRHLQAAETAKLTRMLNSYAQRFLTQFFAEVLGGEGVGEAFGGTGGGEEAVHTDGHRGDRKAGGAGKRGDSGGGSGDKRGRVRRFPEVLVAGVDPDPFSQTGDTLELSERHPTLYQRAPVDVTARIYWINTQAPYPRFLLDTFGEGHAAWKNYVLVRHRDVVIKEALRHMTEREGLDLSLENVNNRMDELTDEFLNSLDQGIADSLFRGGPR